MSALDDNGALDAGKYAQLIQRLSVEMPGVLAGCRARIKLITIEIHKLSPEPQHHHHLQSLADKNQTTGS